MSQLISFEDAVTAANLDPSQAHAVYYADGRFANRTAVARQCPHAKLYGITVLGQTGPGIFACDSEVGDLSVDSAVAWADRQVALGVKLVVVYANLNRWLNEGLKARLEHYGPRIKRWVALYDNTPHIQPWADAEQYANPGPIDRDVALANFFGDATPTPRPVHGWSAELQVSIPEGSRGVLNFAGTVELATGQWEAHGTPGSVHFSGPGGGVWRVKGLPLDAKPLGNAS